MRKPKIGIMGKGVVGGVVFDYFSEHGFAVWAYDKYKKIGSIEEVNQADIVFICVPTPRDAKNQCDVSIVKEAIGYLRPGKVVVVKSTIIPGTTDELQNIFPENPLFFNPEFLTENTAKEDFIHPKFQIVGAASFAKQEMQLAQLIMDILPAAEFSAIMPAKDAEMFKYVRNSFLAAKNAFFNQVYDLCRQAGIDYGNIKRCAETDPWIGPQHLETFHRGKRGFNGKCLPKDTEALESFAREQGVDMSVLRTAIEFNSRLLASQNIKKDS